ncbi:MAG TPA: heme exporter protein CcmD [Candidatus Competibacteraceae bacterium]|nr:heme exporter protein CcmD [Candidatus Competibacteraceae bacterium]
MDGYAFYVWTAYCLTVVVLTGAVLAPLLRYRRLEREVARRARLEQRQAEKPKR